MTGVVGEEIRPGAVRGQARALDFLLGPVGIQGGFLQGNGFHEVARGAQGQSETEPPSSEVPASLSPHWTLCYRSTGQTKKFCGH